MDAPDSFNTIGDAFVWYSGEGGQREKTSFYAKVPRSSGSKRISRFAVSEMLRKERTPSGAIRSDEEKEALELRLLRVKVSREERAGLRDEGKVIDRDVAEMAMAKKLVVIYAKIKAQFRRDQDQVIHKLDLEPNKSSLLLTEVMGCVDRAFNGMRDQKIFDVMIEDDNASI